MKKGEEDDVSLETEYDRRDIKDSIMLQLNKKDPLAIDIEGCSLSERIEGDDSKWEADADSLPSDATRYSQKDIDALNVQLDANVNNSILQVAHQKMEARAKNYLN